MSMTAGNFISKAREFKPDFDTYQLAYYRGKMELGKHYKYLTPKLIVYYDIALNDLKKYLNNKEIENKEVKKFGDE